MYLIDTNIWLERLLDQERSSEVGSFLDRMSSNHLFITDFSFHSDDTYQYTAAEKYTLTLVSFDSDFDRTERGRKMPGEVVKD